MSTSRASTLGLRGGKVFAELQRFGIRGVEAQGAGDCFLRFRQFRLHRQGCGEADPGLGVSGSRTDGKTEMFFGGGGIAAARVQVAKLILRGCHGGIDIYGLLQDGALSPCVAGFVQSECLFERKLGIVGIGFGHRGGRGQRRPCERRAHGGLAERG